MKKMSALFLVLLISISFGGCGTKSDTPSTISSAGESSSQEPAASGSLSKEPVTISFVWAELEEERQKVWQDYFFDPFIAANPNVTIDFQCIPNAGDTLRVQLAASAGPDMLMLDCFDIPDFSSSGRIIDLEKYRAQYKWDDVIYEWAVKAAEYGGKLYGLPHSSEATFMYYNKTLLDKLGVGVPSSRKEFEAACEAAKKAGIIPISYGYSGMNLFNQWVYEHYLTTYSGNENLAKLFKGEIKFDDPSIKGAFELIKQDWDSGYINEKKSGAITFEEARTFFANGQSVFNFEGSWLTLSDTTPGTWKFDWGCGAWPSMRDGTPAAGASGVGAAIAINANSKNPDICGAILNQFYSDKATLAKAISAGYQTLCCPVDASLYPSDMEADVKKTLEAQDAVLSSDSVGYAPWSMYPAKTNQYLMDNLDKIYYEQSSIDNFLKGAQDVLDKELADGFKFAG